MEFSQFSAMIWYKLFKVHPTKKKIMQILQIQPTSWQLRSRQHKEPGPRLNIKTVLSTYGDFHVKDKTAVIFNMGIAISGKTVFLIETAPRSSTGILSSYFVLEHSIFAWELAEKD